nr:MAG TPA_asm: hypothetical protein [Caudoviricetes sp.]DAS73672.1 MAG TPA: hypothetical protein [Caudoviricetes sp.]DAV35398.1 MAG TPA: hypothetical protein [Bacteriophage sp.]DAX88843.1 MAG TPA: hypothetical protein [Caudoviricetes sp.]DAY39397.1 MAG TPA: hypothetical protein [Caudoviricetes sp.]
MQPVCNLNNLLYCKDNRISINGWILIFPLP